MKGQDKIIICCLAAFVFLTIAGVMIFIHRQSNASTFRKGTGGWQYQGNIPKENVAIALGKPNDLPEIQVKSSESTLILRPQLPEAVFSEKDKNVVLSDKKNEIHFQLTDKGVKEDILLKSAAEIQESYLYEIELTNLLLKEGVDGKWYFYDQKSPNTYPIFVIPKLFMIDSGGDRSFSVVVKNIAQNGKNYLEVRPDLAWLKKQGRAFPVRIDPSIEVINNGDKGKYVKTSWAKNFLAEHPDYANLEIYYTDRYSIHFLLPDGKIEAKFTQFPMNYKDASGSWLPIDTTLIQTGDLYQSETGLPVTLKIDGTVNNTAGQFSQKTGRVGIFDPETRAFTPLQNFSAGTISENTFVEEKGNFRREITLLRSSLREELKILNKPEAAIKPYQWLMMETEMQGVAFTDGWLDEFLLNGYRFPIPSTYDASGQGIPTQRYALTSETKQFIYTGVPLSLLAGAAYPVTIDPDYYPAASADDGEVSGYRSTYAAAHDNPSGYNFSSATFDIGQRLLAGPNYEVNRGYLAFDTSGITDGAQIIQVNLKGYLVNKYVDGGGRNFDANIYDYDWSARTPSTDWGTMYTECHDNTAQDQSWGNSASMTNGNWYTSANMSTTWVSVIAKTYYCLKSSYDAAVSAPPSAGNEFMTMATYDSANDPYLTVLYDVTNSCGYTKNDASNSIAVNWLDLNTGETGYQVQKSTDAGAFADLANVGAGVTGTTDNTVSIGHTYQYRVRARYTGFDGNWCTTSTMSLQSGSMRFEGVRMEGIKIN